MVPIPRIPRYLNGWYGPNLKAYTAGTSVSGGDFDIADVSLQTPPSGATVPLPYTFSWLRRSTPTDTHGWAMFDPAPSSSYWWETGELGAWSTYDLLALPPGTVYGKEYGWIVQVFNGQDSFGESYYYFSVTFRAPTTGSAAVVAQPAGVVRHTSQDTLYSRNILTRRTLITLRQGSAAKRCPASASSSPFLTCSA